MSEFIKLGLTPKLKDVIEKKGWKSPTNIQKSVIPVALSNDNLLALSEAGSGKTGAFVLPLLHKLLVKPKLRSCAIIAPTRELVEQIMDVITDLGQDLNILAISLIGGHKTEMQTKLLTNKKWNIVVGTPGRIVYHVVQSKAIDGDRIKYLVLDEADQLMSEKYLAEFSVLLENLSKDRKTWLFSATLNDNPEKLEIIGLKEAKRIELNSKYSKGESIDHAFIFLPDDQRDMYLIHLLKSSGISAKSHKCIIFVNAWKDSYRLGKLINQILGDEEENRVCIYIHGHMKQSDRLKSINNFKKNQSYVLVATDLAARGLDIPKVDLVINYDIPMKPTWSDTSKTYVHRIGRTGRAGNYGRSLSFVTPYTATYLKMIETSLGEQVPQLPWQPNSIDNYDQISETISKANKVIKEDLVEISNKEKHERTQKIKDKLKKKMKKKN